MKRPLTLIALAVVLAALAFLGFARLGAGTNADADAARRRAERESAAAATERSTNSAQAPLGHAEKRAVPQAGAGARNTAGTGAAAAPLAASPSSGPRAPRDRLHAAWQGERPDPAWTAEAQELLSQSAAAVGIDVKLYEPLSCRQSLCRAPLEVARASDLRTLSQVTWGKPTVGFSAPGPGHRYEIYVARTQADLIAVLDERESEPPGRAQGAVREQ